MKGLSVISNEKYSKNHVVEGIIKEINDDFFVLSTSDVDRKYHISMLDNFDLFNRITGARVRGTTNPETDINFWKQFGINVLPTEVKNVKGLELFHMKECYFSTCSYFVKSELGSRIWRLASGPTTI